MRNPLIGITADLNAQRYESPTGCAAVVARAGGTPVLLPCLPDRAGEYASGCDGIILSGGDDPIMEHWGVPTHPRAKPVSARRQAFELALLSAAESRPELAVLGICLGMQMMGLFGGGALDQYLAESSATSGLHWPKTSHALDGRLGEGTVYSHHRQALTDPGTLRVVASAPDGVIEAIQDEGRRFYLGVQWHPERTGDAGLGAGVIRRLVEAAAGTAT